MDLEEILQLLGSKEPFLEEVERDSKDTSSRLQIAELLLTKN